MKRAKPEVSREQYELLEYIVRYTEANGYQPSQQEMGAHFKITQTAVRSRLESLAMRGFLTMTGKDRAIRLTGLKYKALLDRKDVEEVVKAVNENRRGRDGGADS